MLPNFPVLKGYVIWHPLTGLYSRGGMPGGRTWAKKPKIWSNIGHLKNHLSQYVHYDYSERKVRIYSTYDGAVILDVTTGQPATDIILDNYLLERAETICDKYKTHDKEFWTVSKS